MINWPKRLAKEEPFFRELFKKCGARRVLDLGCGTGQHALMFAKWGLEVVGVDSGEAMVDQARENAAAVGIRLALLHAGFGDFRRQVNGLFDAVLVLGNSLPHLLSSGEVRKCVDDIAGVLSPSGVVIIQNRNYDRKGSTEQRFMPLSAWEQEGETRLFLRFTDRHADRVDLNIVSITGKNGKWDYKVVSNPLRPITKDELDSALLAAGLQKRQFFGDYQLNPFVELESTDLVAIAGFAPPMFSQII